MPAGECQVLVVNMSAESNAIKPEILRLQKLSFSSKEKIEAENLLFMTEKKIEIMYNIRKVALIESESAALKGGFKAWFYISNYEASFIDINEVSDMLHEIGFGIVISVKNDGWNINLDWATAT